MKKMITRRNFLKAAGVSAAALGPCFTKLISRSQVYFFITFTQTS